MDLGATLRAATWDFSWRFEFEFRQLIVTNLMDDRWNLSPDVRKQSITLFWRWQLDAASRLRNVWRFLFRSFSLREKITSCDYSSLDTKANQKERMPSLASRRKKDSNKFPYQFSDLLGFSDWQHFDVCCSFTMEQMRFFNHTWKQPIQTDLSWAIEKLHWGCLRGWNAALSLSNSVLLRDWLIWKHTTPLNQYVIFHLNYFPPFFIINLSGWFSVK